MGDDRIHASGVMNARIEHAMHGRYSGLEKVIVREAYIRKLATARRPESWVKAACSWIPAFPYDAVAAALQGDYSGLT